MENRSLQQQRAWQRWRNTELIYHNGGLFAQHFLHEKDDFFVSWVIKLDAEVYGGFDGICLINSAALLFGLVAYFMTSVKVCQDFHGFIKQL